VLFWIFSGLAAIVAAALALGLWAMSRDARRRERRARAELPDTIRLPEGRD
jgi:Flp pilus assembly protein TadB